MTNKSEIPPDLQPMYDLVMASFPNGIDDDLYVPLLAVLGGRESHRNVADVIAIHTGKDWGVVYNDVLKALSSSIRAEDVAAVERRLEPHGLARWRRD